MTGPAHPPTPDLHTFEHHRQDEADAAYLYRLLSSAEPDEKKKDIYRRLAEVEDRHVEVWGNLLRQHGREPRTFRPSARTRLLAGFGRMFGPGFLLPMLLAEEGREVKGYLEMHRRTASGAPGRERIIVAGEGIGRPRNDTQFDHRQRPASRGIAPSRADFCATWSTDSTTGSRRTSGSSPA